MAGSAATRVKFAPVEGAAPLFTPVFLDYLVDLHDRFTPRIGELLARRAEALTRAHTRSVLPSNPPTSAATTGRSRMGSGRLNASGRPRSGNSRVASGSPSWSGGRPNWR